MGRKTKQLKPLNDDPFYVIDKNSQIINTINYGDRIIRKEQIDHVKEYDDNFNKGEHFVKIFDETLKILVDKLTNGEIAFIIKLLPYISYNDAILRNKKGKILTLVDLSEVLDLTHEGVRKVIVSLISKGVLGEHKTGSIDNPKIINKCYTVNPFIFMKGQKMNRTIIGLFENSEWNLKLAKP